jgi:hypothetical protein
MGICAGAEETGRLAGLLPINHDPRYHEIYYLSSTIIVLIFSELPYLFERFRKQKKTKG